MLGIRYKRYIYSIKIYRTQTKGGLRPVFPLISPVLQEAPRAPRYKEGVAGDTQPVRPGGGGEEGAVVAEERQRGADRRQRHLRLPHEEREEG